MSMTNFKDIAGTALGAITSQSIILDPADLIVGPAGVENYYWPVRSWEIDKGAADIVAAFLMLLRNETLDRQDRTFLAVASAPLLMPIVSVFAAQLLATRLRNDGYQAKLPDKGADLWRSSFLGVPWQEERLVPRLQAGLKRPPLWQRALRPLASLRSRDDFSRRFFDWIDLQNDIVTVTSCPLTIKRARSLDIKPVYCRLYEWFYPPSEEELRHNPLCPIGQELRAHVAEEIGRVFVEHDAAGSRMPADAILSLIDQATAWVRFYLNRLDRQAHRLPKHLWKGTSGIIWSRLLAEAVRSNGGTVTGHDHAYGANFCENTLMPFVELQGNDVFVTYSQPHVELYKRVGPKLVFSKRMPEIVTAEGQLPAKHHPRLYPPKGGGTPRSILYATPYLPSTLQSVMPLMLAPMAFDWQARLFGMLRGWEFDVTQKPHPETQIAPHRYFEVGLGVRTRIERFEAVMSEYDILLFDYAPSTAFGSALRSDLPVVLIDFGVTSYLPEWKEKLAKRCAIVEGWFDDQNRAQVDRDRLYEAILFASQLNDHTYPDEIIAL